MIQIQYKNVGGVPKPSPADIAAWRRAFIMGRAVPGVAIHAIDWRFGGTQQQIRARLRKPWRASVAGIVDRYAGPSITMCDYDRPNEKPMKRIWAVARMLGLKIEWIEWARTKRGWHVVVKWSREFNPAETVAIQAILGSDAFRETYNLARVMSGQGGRRWNLLFREKIR